MKPETLQHFSRQLHSWCVERLVQKPGPFRQAELQPHLLGHKESLSPPVVLWVNRESCLAGGVILLPRKAEDDIFDSGIETARALGLPNFHTWGRHEVTCWSAVHNPPEKLWQYDLPPTDSASPTSFRKSFNQLVEHMEQAFFANQLLIPEISDLYLANLMHTTFIDLLPEIQKNLHVGRSETGDVSISSTVGTNLLLQKLIPPLGLALSDTQYTSSPDTIFDSIASAISTLPDNLIRSWSDLAAFPPFPKECIRRFHHYCCRIRQLTPLSTETVIPAVERLLNQWAPQLGGFPVPERTSPLKRVVINASNFDSNNSPALEISPPGILAATALLGQFSHSESSESAQQFTSVFSLTNELPQHLIIGTLYETNQPTSTEQKELNAILRISWPNRKLALPGKTPAWVWQFLHLAGLTGKMSQMDLIIPADWLWLRYGENIMPVLSGKLFFSNIRMNTSFQLHCQLFAANEENSSTTVTLANGHSRILASGPPERLRPGILLALNLPDEIYQLIDTKVLQMRALEELEELPKAGLTNFIHSSLGLVLWQVIAPGRVIPKSDKLSVELSKAGLPVPGKDALLSLARLTGPGGEISTTDIDQELSVWLGHLPLQPVIIPSRSNRKTTTVKPEESNRFDHFYQRCLAEEIPLFPENYLYDTPFKERSQYTFSGPLKIVDSFFDQIILADQERRMTVNGTRHAEALVLVSSLRSGSVELPQSSVILADMLDRYYRDLGTLRQRFSQHAAEINDGKNIAAAVDSVWTKLQLPRWPLTTGQ